MEDRQVGDAADRRPPQRDEVVNADAMAGPAGRLMCRFRTYAYPALVAVGDPDVRWCRTRSTRRRGAAVPGARSARSLGVAGHVNEVGDLDDLGAVIGSRCSSAASNARSLGSNRGF